MVDGDPSSLIVSESVAMPGLEPTELLIRVSCAGINQLDLMQLRGGCKVPEGVSEVPGLEVSGTVVQVGKRCSKGFREGDDVMALLPGGGYAEFVSADLRSPAHGRGPVASFHAFWITAFSSRQSLTDL